MFSLSIAIGPARPSTYLYFRRTYEGWGGIGRQTTNLLISNNLQGRYDPEGAVR